MRRHFLVSLALLCLMVPGLTACSHSPADNSSEPRAAIIDQLDCLSPNQAFISQMTETLEARGFSVDLWQGEEVTVDLYRRLPTYDYKLIIFRAHSGLLWQVKDSQAELVEATYLFTGETYNKTSHIPEQLADRLANAQMTVDYPLVFAINSEFVRKSMEGRFDNTAIVMMGCFGLCFDDMAAAFAEKGASAYLGWNASIMLDYVDNATLHLLSNLCQENVTVEEGVAMTLSEVGPDRHFNAWLNYYPPGSGGQTITQLIK